jgi:hypothetical protein
MAAPIASLLDAFAQIDDPRKPRGVRHPFTSILALTSLGLLCRETDLACLRRWARDRRRVLKGAPGSTREKPPHATTISRALAGSSLGQFRDAFARRLVGLPGTGGAVVASADGEASKQGRDAHGDPTHMLNVFARELGLSPAQFPVTGGKPTEPRALEAGPAGLLGHCPFLRLFTADALFTRRPLARVVLDADRDFLFTVKDDQPGLLEAIEAGLRDADARPPDAETAEKEGGRSTPASSGSRRARRSLMSARRPLSPASS